MRPSARKRLSGPTLKRLCPSLMELPEARMRPAGWMSHNACGFERTLREIRNLPEPEQAR